MKKVRKIQLAILIASTIMIASSFAQTEDNTWYSNSYKTTAETFRTDGENYIDARYFNEVNFENLFLNTNFTNEGFNIGVAKKFNNLYVSGFYNGNFWGNLKGFNRKQNHNTNIVNKENENLNSNSSSDDEYIHNNTTGENGNSHKAIVLFGFPNKMGLKIDTEVKINGFTDESFNKSFSYNLSLDEITNESNNNPESIVKDISNEYNLNLIWSCYNIENRKIILKPWVRLGVDVHDFRKVWSHNTSNKKTDPNNTSNNKHTTSNYNEIDYTNFYPTLNINLGTNIALKSDSKFHQLFNLEYGLKANLYSKYKSTTKHIFTNLIDENDSYTYDVTSTRKGIMNFTNSLNGAYRFNINPIEKLSIAGRIGLGTDIKVYSDGITSESVKYYKKNYSYVSVDGKIISENGVPKEVTYPSTTESKKDYHIDTAIKTNFGIGVRYAIKPTFILNLGYGGKLPYVNINTHTVSNNTTTINDKDGKDVSTNNSKTSNIETTTTNYESTLSTGFTWNIANSCVLDVSVILRDEYGNETRSPSANSLWTAGWNLGFSFKK